VERRTSEIKTKRPASRAKGWQKGKIMTTPFIKKIATKAIEKEYGFSPSHSAITLLESDGDGIYILFRMGKHEFRLIDGNLTDVTLEKEKNEAVAATYSFYIDREKKFQFAEVERDELRKEIEALRAEYDDLKKQQEKQEKLFFTKENMLADAYNAKQYQINILNGKIRFFQSLADDRMKEIERLEAKNKDLKAELEDWEAQHRAVSAARRKAAYYAD